MARDKEKMRAYMREYRKRAEVRQYYREYGLAYYSDPANRERRRAYLSEYRRSIDGFLAHAYASMKRRVEGKGQERTRHIYKGLPLLPQDEFMNWARQDRAFLYLHKQWAAADYDYKLSPSVNRVVGKLGYVLGNIEWLTHSDNCSLGGMVGGKARWKKSRANTCIERIIADVKAA